MMPELRRRMLLSPLEHIIGPAYFQFTSSGTLDLSQYNFEPGDSVTVICIGYGGGKGGTAGYTPNNGGIGGGGGNGGNGYGGGNGGAGGNGVRAGSIGKDGENGGKAGEYKKETLILTVSSITITINTNKTQCDTIIANAKTLTGGGAGGSGGYYEYGSGGGGGGAGAPGWYINYTTKTASRAAAWNPNNGTAPESDTAWGGTGAPNNKDGTNGHDGDKIGAGICVIWPNY